MVGLVVPSSFLPNGFGWPKQLCCRCSSPETWKHLCCAKGFHNSSWVSSNGPMQALSLTVWFNVTCSNLESRARDPSEPKSYNNEAFWKEIPAVVYSTLCLWFSKLLLAALKGVTTLIPCSKSGLSWLSQNGPLKFAEFACQIKTGTH